MLLAWRMGMRQIQLFGNWSITVGGRIEHGYRFDQEQGLDVKDMRVRTLERMRRLFTLISLAVQFAFFLMKRCPPGCPVATPTRR